MSVINLVEQSLRLSPRTSAKSPPRSGGFGLSAGVLLTIPLLIAFLVIGFDLKIALPLALLLGMAVSRFLTQILNSRNDLFSPLSIIAGYFILNIGLRTVYRLISPSAEQLGLSGYDDYIPTALWLAILAYFSFLAGYLSPFGRLLRRKLPGGEFRWPAAVPALQITLVLILAVGAMLFLLKKGGGVHGLEVEAIGDQDNGFGRLFLVAKTASFAFTALWICKFSQLRLTGKRLLMPLLLLSLVALLAQIVVTGSKRATYEPLVQGLIVFHYVKSRVNIWQLTAIGLPAILIGFGAVNFYRFVVVGQSTTPRSVTELANRVSTAATRISEGSTGAQKSAFDQMLNRQTGVDTLAIVSKFTPNPNPPLMGAQVLDALISLIPHPLWPNRPVYAPGRYFERYFLGIPSSSDPHIAIHVIADLYMNFSYLGIPVGMFLIGVLLRSLYLFCSPGPGNPSGVFFYAVLLPNLLSYMEGTIGSDIVFIVHLAVPLALVAFFFGIRYLPVRRLRKSALGFDDFPPSGLPASHGVHHAMPIAP